MNRPLRRVAFAVPFSRVVVVVIVAILTAMAAALTRGVIAGQKRSLTVARMAAVDAALGALDVEAAAPVVEAVHLARGALGSRTTLPFTTVRDYGLEPWTSPERMVFKLPRELVA